MRSFLVVVSAFLVTMLGTTMPTPLYGFYQAKLGFGLTTVTVIFATYAFGVLVALLAFGRWSDVVGRRPLLLAGLCLSALSDVVFLTADATWVLLVARVASGLSAGIYVGTATAAVLEAAPSGWQRRAPLVATVANIGGLGLGPLLAGALVDAFDHPLTIAFWIHLVMAVLVGVALLVGVPETVERTPGERLSFQRPDVPAPIARTFVGAAAAGFAGFAVTGLIMAVSPKLVALAVSDPSPLLVGFVAFVPMCASALAQVALTPLSTPVGINLGIGLLVLGLLILIVGVQTEDLWVLIVAAAVAGAGQGVSFSKGLATLLARVEPHEKAGVSSAFFVVAYVAISLPVIGEGLAARAWSLTSSATVFSGLVAALALGALAILVLDQRREAA
ncbi:MFS transporter [Nocardioides sp. Kera G14]|uniref:MFS transporter n=1 Tax=Nocardioides sp. Kera G14 TaxID=2884264 RepID=UPI001D10003C|nr:MFS transporter [Nocardioides sp. Kera G14]UDY22663.1 MFS transporter [Nocardioides sp. Kera G14]